MSDALNSTVPAKDYNIPDEGMAFLKRTRISPAKIQDFIFACSAQIIKDGKRIETIKVGFFRESKDPKNPKIQRSKDPLAWISLAKGSKLKKKRIT